MSYLTGRCNVCSGTARIHKQSGTTCTKESDCSGCVRCRDCIDGKVVGGSASGSNIALGRQSTVSSTGGSNVHAERISRGGGTSKRNSQHPGPAGPMAAMAEAALMQRASTSLVSSTGGGINNGQAMGHAPILDPALIPSMSLPPAPVLPAGTIPSRRPTLTQSTFSPPVLTSPVLASPVSSAASTTTTTPSQQPATTVPHASTGRDTPPLASSAAIPAVPPTPVSPKEERKASGIRTPKFARRKKTLDNAAIYASIEQAFHGVTSDLGTSSDSGDLPASASSTTNKSPAASTKGASSGGVGGGFNALVSRLKRSASGTGIVELSKVAPAPVPAMPALDKLHQEYANQLAHQGGNGGGGGAVVAAVTTVHAVPVASTWDDDDEEGMPQMKRPSATDFFLGSNIAAAAPSLPVGRTPTIIHRRSISGPRIQTLLQDLHTDVAQKVAKLGVHASIDELSDQKVATEYKPVFESYDGSALVRENTIPGRDREAWTGADVAVSVAIAEKEQQTAKEQLVKETVLPVSVVEPAKVLVKEPVAKEQAGSIGYAGKDKMLPPQPQQVKTPRTGKTDLFAFARSKKIAPATSGPISSSLPPLSGNSENDSPVTTEPSSSLQKAPSLSSSGTGGIASSNAGAAAVSPGGSGVGARKGKRAASTIPSSSPLATAGLENDVGGSPSTPSLKSTVGVSSFAGTADSAGPSSGSRLAHSLGNSSGMGSQSQGTPTSYSAQQPGSPNPHASHTSVATTPVPPVKSGSDSHRRSASRNFRDWYAKFTYEASKQRLEGMAEENEFPDPVTLQSIYGSRRPASPNSPRDAVVSLLRTHAFIESIRHDGLWESRLESEAPGKMNLDPEILEDVACTYRPLDIFHDGPIPTLYQGAPLYPGGPRILTAGKPDDLLDALIFPLGQDMSFAEVFLATYRFFMPAGKVLAALIEWYNVDMDQDLAVSAGGIGKGGTGGLKTSGHEASGMDSAASDVAGESDASVDGPGDTSATSGAMTDSTTATDSAASPTITTTHPTVPHVIHQTDDQFLKKHRKHIQSRAIRVLLMWVKNHWHDFQGDRELYITLMAFLEHVSGLSFGDGQKLSQAIREQRLSWYTLQYIPPFQYKRGVMNDNTKPWALVWTPEQFAREITNVDQFYFRQIRPDTYLRVLARPVARRGGSRDVGLKVLLEYVTWFRLIVSYIATIVIREDSTKRKAKILKQLIKIATACRAIHNYNALFAIVAALKKPAIVRATSAWEALSAKHLDVFQGLMALLEPKDGYARYWAEFKDVSAPAIPFLPAYMGDLLDIHYDAPGYLDDAAALAGSTTTMDTPTYFATRARRKGARTRTATGDASVHSAADEESNSATTGDPSPTSNAASSSSTSGPPAMVNSSASNHQFHPDYSPSRMIHFQKYYDLYTIAAELDAFRLGTSLYPPAADKDSGAIVLTHLREFALEKETGRFMDDVLGADTVAGTPVGVGEPGQHHAAEIFAKSSLGSAAGSMASKSAMSIHQMAMSPEYDRASPPPPPVPSLKDVDLKALKKRQGSVQTSSATTSQH
ncbi:hypothetical protein DFS34DRAFT_635930 [Phlyctochytrium arcticum]|nr:hypothetical protein DFS34DRAFT_635930 [Phlyctochytrium arcticum]